MRNAMTKIVGTLAVLWVAAGAAIAAPINLAPFSFTFNHPIGIDFQDTSGQLIMSVNYFFGTPHNLDLVNSTTGAPTQFSTLSGLTNELKIATVRNTTCLGGFAPGEVFTGNGNPGEVVRLGPTGTLANPVAPYAWATLPLEPADIRGSLFQDRFCVAGGDVIVITGNEQTGFAATDSVGNVWRIKNNDPNPPTTTKVATIGTHLEGVVTLPNLPLVHGPAAGKILAGAEEFLLLGRNPATSADYDPNGGAIYVIDPSGLDVWFTISNGHSLATPCTLDINGQATPNHCNFHTDTAFHPEDLDVIRRNSQFFGVAFSEGHVLTTVDQTGAADFHQFDNVCGQVLITQELPFAGTSGLSSLSWNGTGFVVTPITSNRDGTIFQWEHVTFTSGDDCATTIGIVKTPDSHTFNIGDTLEWNIVVSNTGALTALDVKLDDPLPTTGGLTWSVFSVSAGTCNAIPASQILHCDLGNIAPGASVTVVVHSSNVGGAPAASCTQIDNTATASASNALPKSDDGHQSCTPPPHLKVVKTPDGGPSGTFTQGGAVSFTIVVSNDGLSTATTVQLSDQLPTNGGLNWSTATVTTSQGSCSVSAGSLLTCSIGSINAGGSVTVTVSLASTPAAACQSQPNPVALATAGNAPSAQDAGSLTCTPPPPGGLIAPTETTCQQFSSGTASTLGQINYSVSNGKIGQGINPGVFFYFAKITTTVANTVVTVSESQNDAAALFQILNGQARLYTADCSSFTNGTLNGAATGASFTIATAGTYIISVKYTTKSIAGTSAPTSDPVTYTFTATPPGASSSASVLLKKQ